MIGDKSKFINLNKNKSGTVVFGNDNEANIIGKGTVNLGTKKGKAENVFLVEDMTHNLLSVNQICDQGHVLTVDSKNCKIRKKHIGKLVATTSKTPNNVYIFNETKEEKWCVG